MRWWVLCRWCTSSSSLEARYFVAAHLGSMFCQLGCVTIHVSRRWDPHWWQRCFCHSFWVETMAETVWSFDSASTKNQVSTAKVLYSGKRDILTSTKSCESTWEGTNSRGAWILSGLFWWWWMCDHGEWTWTGRLTNWPKHRFCTDSFDVSWQIRRRSFRALQPHRTAQGLLDVAGLQLHHATRSTSAESCPFNETRTASDSSRCSDRQSRSSKSRRTTESLQTWRLLPKKIGYHLAAIRWFLRCRGLCAYPLLFCRNQAQHFASQPLRFKASTCVLACERTGEVAPLWERKKVWT